MTKPKVLLLGTIDHEEARKEYEALSKYADLITPQSHDRQGFLNECKSGSLDGVRCIYRTFMSVQDTGPFDEELISALPASVRFVSHCGAGYDQVDVAACTKRGIYVSHVPGAVDDATADTGVFLTLGALRGFSYPLLSLRQGKWRGVPPPGLGHDPEGKTLGILGMGGIGKNMSRKLQAFGMKVIYHNRTKLDELQEGGATYVDFDELLARSDVLSLNLPLNAHTRHLISEKEFAKMKKGIVIVNTARGAVIDEAALVKAIEDGVVWSVGLDVFEDEPNIHPGLLNNENVILLPHMGTHTFETLTAMEKVVVKNIRCALLEKRLVNRVPEQKDMDYEA